MQMLCTSGFADDMMAKGHWRIIHRDSPGYTAKLRTRGAKSAIVNYLVSPVTVNFDLRPRPSKMTYGMVKIPNI